MKTNVIVLTVLLTSCATIVNGPQETVSVSSNPPGATVSDEIETKETPTHFVLDRNRDYILTISKLGYETQTVKISHVVSGWVAGNIISFGFVGAGIDAASGAMWELKPDTIVVALRPIEWYDWFLPSRLTSQTVQSTMDELDSLKENGLITETEYNAIKQVILSTAFVAQ